jgi:hypothetical protein
MRTTPKDRAALLGIVLLLAMTLGACTPSAITAQARAATALHPLIEQAHSEILTSRGEAMSRAVLVATSEEEARGLVEEERNRFAPAVLAYETTREAFNAWVRALVRHLDGASTMVQVIEAATAALEAFDELVELAREIGLDVQGMESTDEHQ